MGRRHHPFRHCFSHVGYHAADLAILLNFSDGSVYTYTSVSLTTWNFIAANWSSGHLFNLHWRKAAGVGYVVGDATIFPETDGF